MSLQEPLSGFAMKLEGPFEVDDCIFRPPKGVKCDTYAVQHQAGVNKISVAVEELKRRFVLLERRGIVLTPEFNYSFRVKQRSLFSRIAHSLGDLQGASEIFERCRRVALMIAGDPSHPLERFQLVLLIPLFAPKRLTWSHA